MGYDRIIDWVEDHFKPSDYSSYFAFEQAVKQRFNSDGIDLPKGAQSQMMDYFEKHFETQDTSIIAPIPMDSYTPPEPEILQISEDFFKIGAPFEEPQTPIPEIFQDATPTKPTFFGKIGGFFRRLFGR